MDNLFSPEAEEEVFGTIMKLIARLSETREDVQKILSDLHDADWDTMLAHHLYYDQEAHDDYFNDWYCACCFEDLPRSQMSKIQGWNSHFYYCPACQEQIKQKYAYTWGLRLVGTETRNRNQDKWAIDEVKGFSAIDFRGFGEDE
jgi:hypothetical protein